MLGEVCGLVLSLNNMLFVIALSDQQSSTCMCARDRAGMHEARPSESALISRYLFLITAADAASGLYVK